MSDEQKEIGFGNKDERFAPKKSLYDKILENQGKKDSADQRDDADEGRDDADERDSADQRDSGEGRDSVDEKDSGEGRDSTDGRDSGEGRDYTDEGDSADQGDSGELVGNSVSEQETAAASPTDEEIPPPAPLPPPAPVDEPVVEEMVAAAPPPPPVVEETVAAAPPPPPIIPDDPVVKKPMEEKPKSGKRNKRLTVLFSVLIVIMLGVIGYLVYTLIVEREEAEEMKFTLELQKDNLANELNEIYAQYDSLQTNNDSMNTLIQERQNEIRNLLAIRASNSKKIQIYEEQVSSLRSVLRDFVIQVDSLNTANLRLRAENKAAQDQIRRATSSNRKLEEQNKDLVDKVEKASAVKALNVYAEPIDNNGNVARKIKRTDKIKVSFALADNAIAKAGLKRIYIRIGNPNQRTMTKNPADVFEFEGKSIPYSADREVEYEGTQLPVSIYYDADDGEIISGTYYVDLFMDGELIGTTSFSLK